MPRINPSDNRSGHTERTPINGSRNLLTVKGIPSNLHPVWVNDVEDGQRIQQYLDAGYDFWMGDTKVGDNRVDGNSQIGKKVSRGVGNGVTAYLLVCPMEIYLDECRRIDEETDGRTEGMFRGMKEDSSRYGKVTVETKLHKS
jgi:hypothetical protein